MSRAVRWNKNFFFLYKHSGESALFGGGQVQPSKVSRELIPQSGFVHHVHLATQAKKTPVFAANRPIWVLAETKKL